MDVNPMALRPSFWEPFIKAAVMGELQLQVCSYCHTVNYPPAEICAECLHCSLEWEPVNGKGRVLATTEVMATPDDFFKQLLPVGIGSVKLDSGPVVVAFFPDPSLAADSQVRVESAIDSTGAAVLVAHNQQTNVSSKTFDWKGSSLQTLFSDDSGENDEHK